MRYAPLLLLASAAVIVASYFTLYFFIFATPVSPNAYYPINSDGYSFQAKFFLPNYQPHFTLLSLVTTETIIPTTYQAQLSSGDGCRLFCVSERAYLEDMPSLETVLMYVVPFNCTEVTNYYLPGHPGGRKLFLSYGPSIPVLSLPDQPSFPRQQVKLTLNEKSYHDLVQCYTAKGIISLIALCAACLYLGCIIYKATRRSEEEEKVGYPQVYKVTRESEEGKVNHPQV